MSKTDLTPIRERLETLKQAQEQLPDPAAPLWNPPRSPELPPMAHASSVPESVPDRTQLTTTVRALQARSQQLGVQTSLTSLPPPATETPEAAETASPLPAEVALHWQRLQREARVINELAQQQVTALQTFKRSVDRLAWSLRRQPPASVPDLAELCDLQAAVVSQVIVDEQGKLTLTPVSVDLYQDERSAAETAQELRAYARTRSQATVPLSRFLWGYLGDPIAAWASLWQGLTQTLETRTQLTPLSIGGCLIGGWIARWALELLLAAVPGLWPWVAGITVVTVAYALYCLLLAPRSDLVLVARVLLILLGIALGGQF